MKYKGYWAKVQYSDEDECFCGKDEGLKNTLILFNVDSSKFLKASNEKIEREITEQDRNIVSRAQKDAESIKIESKLQDIEIKMKNGNKVLAQAKSSQDYSIAKNKKEKFKDAIISFAKFSDANNKLIYISNIPDMLNTANDVFNNKIVSYESCLSSTKNEINEIFESTLNSIDKKIKKETDSKKLNRLKRVKSNVENIDKTRLYISVIYPFYGVSSPLVILIHLSKVS